jgi:hypothetical protein
MGWQPDPFCKLPTSRRPQFEISCLNDPARIRSVQRTGNCENQNVERRPEAPQNPDWERLSTQATDSSHCPTIAGAAGMSASADMPAAPRVRNFRVRSFWPLQWGGRVYSGSPRPRLTFYPAGVFVCGLQEINGPATRRGKPSPQVRLGGVAWLPKLDHRNLSRDRG